jgi:Flp pilus assembly protein CpaB
MEFRGAARRRRIMMVAGLALAVVAAGSVYYLSNANAVAAQPAPTHTVIVAAVEIPAHVLITSALLAQRSLPDDPSLAKAVLSATDIIGKTSEVVIYKDQPILSNLLASTGAEAGFSILMPGETMTPDSPAWRAVSVSVPKERAVGGQIEAGQHVDLIATMQINVLARLADGTLSGAPSSEGYYSDKATKISWADITVLSNDSENDLYVLRVDLHQAEEIAQVQDVSSSGFSIALRADGDDRVIDRGGYGETVNRIVQQYDFPLPEVLPIEGYPQPSPEPLPFMP